jgi:predicted ATPase/class 3 adenylate cyclase
LSSRVEPERGAVGRALPTGTVTFLRTDIEGSMGLARALGRDWDAVLDRHHEILREAIAAHGGTIVRTEGDAVFAVFPEAGAAVEAAVEGQRRLVAEPWPADAAVNVRMGLHSGEAHLAGDDYGGFDVNRAARVAATGHGGQIVVSDPTAALILDALPEGVVLQPLGRHRLRGVPRPETLWQVQIPGLRSEFPPLRVDSATNGNLPHRLTSFVGRDRELAAVAALLEDARLVTLTGPGGIGKSSLSVEVARAAADAFPDGAWFVALDELDDPTRVTAAIARTLGLFDGPSRTAADGLPDFLAERATLLVLDNFEHLLEAAPSVSALLRASPLSRILITSRAPLRITGEHEYPVRPLGTDDEGATARELFLERARAVVPGWEPGPDAAAVDELCVLLDGLPLGLELAAARVGLMPVTAIRDRLMARLPLPGSGPRDAPARQRTLDGAVAWSHELLTEDQRALLHALAVFEGDFDVEQAGIVEGATDADRWDVLDRLSGLVEHSLVSRDGQARQGDGAAGRHHRHSLRFRLLRTIQSFALDQLAAAGLEQPTRRRHAEAYVALAESAAAAFGTNAQAEALDRLSLDATNLRGATRWAIDAGEVALAQRLVASLWRFWQADGRLVEGRVLADDALAMPDGDGTTVERMWACGAAGSIAYWQGDLEGTRRGYDEELAIAQALDHPEGVADAMFNLGHLAFLDHRDEETLIAIALEAQHAYEAIGDERGVARARWALGNMALGAARNKEALELFAAAMVDFERLGDAQYHAMTSASMSWASFAAGDVPAACRWAIEALLETFAMRDVGTTTISLHVGVLMADMLHRFEDAARLSGAFDALCERYGVRPPAALGRFIDAQDPFAIARGALPPEDWERLYGEGRRMDLEAAVALIVDIGGGFEGVADLALLDVSPQRGTGGTQPGTGGAQPPSGGGSSADAP